MLKFFFHQTPNPMKVALFMAETGLPYELVAIDTLKGEQHSPEYRAVNPNGKLPAILDDGVRVFDSNAILLYLSEKTGQLGGKAEDRAELLSWMMFIASGLGPFSGQAVHFRHVAPEHQYAQNRYAREIERHYEVLDEHLENRQFIVSEQLTIVDLAAWGWLDKAQVVIGDAGLSAYPHLQSWFERINSRPSVAVARDIAKDIDFKSAMDEEARQALFTSNYPKQRRGQ
ncbi:glutathione S-transferase family protein [Motilimonas pumila]|uniref:Glutathione S-transferase family protein n=1 Tax=Motilimonas pumila TaxID=2303987 RepID=A0A418YCD4_9GAMM|nr:glutathione S-transferase family protein [Motilimonas pumila]RJG42156.1 glutathione S-transferase family protein [Motilimonas pumila]